jgi:hypothetical protein
MNNPTILRCLAVFGLFLLLTGAAKAQEKVPVLTGEETQAVFIEADSAYARNAFAQAAPLYRRLLENNRLTTPRALLRLSLIEEAQGNIPQTLYYLNLLYTLQPDEAVRTRMESLARQYQLDGYDMDEWDFFRKLLRRFAIHLFIGFALLIGLLVALLWRRRYRGKPLRLLPLPIVLLLMLASAALNVDVRYGKAIVVNGKAALMEDASAASGLRAMIPLGTRLTVLGESTTWMRVVYKDKQGYVNRNVVWYF